jgi:hypothetical protein
MFIFRFFHRRMNIKRKIITAAPARPPTTPPATTPAGGIDPVPESELLPEAAVLDGALPGAMPVPPARIPSMPLAKVDWDEELGE